MPYLYGFRFPLSIISSSLRNFFRLSVDTLAQVPLPALSLTFGEQKKESALWR